MDYTREQIRLGSELLEMATNETDNLITLENYNKILEMPGIDAALFMLYKAAEFAFSHPKPLLQSAFLLGYYIHESLTKSEKMWEVGGEEPEDSDWTKKARKEVLE